MYRGYHEGLGGLSMKVGPGCCMGLSVVMERFCRGYREGLSGVAEKICQGYCQGLSVVAKRICQGYHEGLCGLFMEEGPMGPNVVAEMAMLRHHQWCQKQSTPSCMT